MRGEIMYKILDLLKNKSIGTFDFFNVVISAGYGASFGKLQYEHSKRGDKRFKEKLEKEKVRYLQRYICNLIKDGLISKDSNNEIILSVKGKNKLKTLKDNFLIVNNSKYTKEVSDKVTIVSYDIPIAFNKERNILRDILKELGFNIVHKSVWVGKVKLPKQFVIDLEKLGILDYVEILEVTKSGSLKSFN